MKDSENDTISYNWEILEESTDLGDGGDYESRPKRIDNHFVTEHNGVLTFTAPHSGHYRLFAYANDGNSHSATANIPFMVK